MSLNIKVTDQSCGAEITGVNLTKSLLEDEISAIREAWLKHHVLSFPNQPMTDDDLERFTLSLVLLVTIHLSHLFQDVIIL